MDELVRRKSEYMSIASAEVQAALGVSFSAFESEKIEAIELAKAITRALLRYDSYSIRLAKSVLKQMQDHFRVSKEISYCTLPYPIIHFSNDTSETGPMHKDSYPYIKSFYTTWTPLNDCFSQPLALLEGSHRRQSAISRLLGKKPEYELVKPDFRTGEFGTWLGDTDHEGLLNRTSDITMALVVRFTSSPIMFEGTLPVNELEHYTLNESSYDVRQVARSFVSAWKDLDVRAKAGKAGSLQAFMKSAKDVITAWNFDATQRRQLSFLLTLWAQRLEQKRDVSLFYLCALLLAQDSLYPLLKTADHLHGSFGASAAVEFLNEFLSNHPSVQAVHIARNFTASKGIHSAQLQIPASPPLLKWSLA